MKPAPRAACRVLSAGLAVVLGSCSAAAAASRADDETRAARAEGALEWVSDEALDLIGELALWASLGRIGSVRLDLHADTATAIQKTIGNFTFLVRELLYRAEIRAVPRRESWWLVAGQQGREGVDRSGQAFARYIGAGWRWERDRLEAEIEFGPVFGEQEVSADGYVRARLRIPLANGPRSRWRLDADYDGFVSDGTLAAELRVGPTWRARGRRGDGLEVFAHYVRDRHPLGTGVRGVLAGLAYRPADGSAGAGAADRMAGVLAAGVARRRAARLWLAFASAPLGGGRLAADFDLNVLTAEDTGDLYYLYRVGYERPRAGWLWGAYFYHRSNHQLGEPGRFVTSLNVLEWAAETARWRFPGVDSAGEARRWDGRVRLGILLTSSFGERRRWHANLGARWWLHRGPWGSRPYLEAEVESGDVQRRRYAAGLRRHRHGWLVEFRRDSEWFSRDRDAWLLVWEFAFGRP